MDKIETKMPQKTQGIMEDLRTLTEGRVWFYLDNKAITRLRESAIDVQEISNLIQIKYKNIKILIAPHTSDWWRLYSMDGKLFFREAANPEAIVFMKG